MWAGMVQQTARGGGGFGGSKTDDEARGGAARQAFWCHLQPFADSWAMLLAPAAGAVGGDGAVSELLLEGAACLLEFLTLQDMPACLGLAAAVASSAGLVPALMLVLDGRQQQQQQQQQQQCDGSSEGIRGAATAEPSTRSAACAAVDASSAQLAPAAQLQQRQEAQQRDQRKQQGQQQGQPSQGQGGLSPSKLIASTDDASCSAAGSSSSLHGSRSRRSQPAVSFRQLLTGFPDPAMEAAYLAFKNARCMQSVDGLASMLGPSFILAWFIGMLARKSPALWPEQASTSPTASACLCTCCPGRCCAWTAAGMPATGRRSRCTWPALAAWCWRLATAWPAS